MDINTFDILVLFILALTSAFIIGINVMYIVDKKLRDIQINVPSHPIHVHKNNQLDNNVCINVKTQKIDRFEDISKITNDKIKAQSISPIANVQNNTPAITNHVSIMQGSRGTGKYSTQPPDTNVISYKDSTCRQNIETGSSTTDVKKIQYDKINNATCRPYTNKSVIEGVYNDLSTGFMTAESNDPNKIIQQDVRFYVPRLYMGIDPYMAGVSYASMSLEIPADINQIGTIPINNYNRDPVAVSAFVTNDH